jgi:hypothetical protein
MRDLILFDRVSGTEGPITYTDVPAQSGHPILANLPSPLLVLRRREHAGHSTYSASTRDHGS